MTWSPDPVRFLADLEAKPAALRRLAASIDAEPPWAGLSASRVVFLGMGSSRFAAGVGAARLRAHGIDAVAEYASAAAGHPGGPGTLAVGISASGGTEETVAGLRRHRVAGSVTVAMTNAQDTAIASHADRVVQLVAGSEGGGVACRTFQHTLVLLLALGSHLSGGADAAALARRAAESTEDLLASREAWLPGAIESLTGTGRAFLVAPAERLSSAEQGALMFREGPRLVADACETGDWLHVDVYLTEPLDYRALLFAGSRFDPALMDWATRRSSTIVAVGADVEGASRTVRYANDEDSDVALLTEVLVAELVAAETWHASTLGDDDDGGAEPA